MPLKPKLLFRRLFSRFHLTAGPIFSHPERTEQLQIEVFAFLNQTKSSGTATREFLTGFYYQFLQLLFRQMDHPGSEDEAFRRQITVASPEQTFSSFGALREWISNSLLLFTQSRQAAASQDTAVATVKAYIESHLSDELDRDTLAAMVYLNADYLSHLFKKTREVLSSTTSSTAGLLAPRSFSQRAK